MNRYTLIPAALLLSLANFAHAQATYDFNDEGGTLTQTGFTGIDTANAGSSIALNSGISLVFNGYGNDGGRDRGTGGLTDSVDFFRDGMTGSDGGGKEMDFAFSGLSASSDYELTFWAWDRQYNNTDTTVQFFNTTSGGSTEVGTVDLVGVQPTSLADYASTFTITSSAAGEITLDVFGIQTSDPLQNMGVLINGFQIAAIPEPGTFALFAGILGLGLVGLRRRAR